MLEELGLGRILAVHGAVLGVHGGLALEEVLLCALPEPVVVQVFVEEGSLALLVLDHGAFPAAADIAGVVLDRRVLDEHALLTGFFVVGVFDIVTVDGSLRPLDVFHRRGQVRPVGIVSLSLHRPLLIEEVLSGCLALHLAFLKDLTKRRLFLLEEM